MNDEDQTKGRTSDGFPSLTGSLHNYTNVWSSLYNSLLLKQSEIKQNLAEISAKSEPAWEAGQVALGEYIAERLLGVGGGGQVWLLRRQGTAMHFAVKRCASKRYSRNTAMLGRELLHWMDLPPHPNLAKCLHFEVVGDEIFIFMEYANGGSLHDWIANGSLYRGTEEQVIKRLFDVAIGSALGMHIMHVLGKVHQDIKPSNILLHQENGGTLRAKLSDFGTTSNRTTKLSENIAGFSFQPMRGCTTPWRSPEQARGEHVEDVTDIWSWGLSMVDMLTSNINVEGRNGEDAKHYFYTINLNRRFHAEDCRIPRCVSQILECKVQYKAQVIDVSDDNLPGPPPVECFISIKELLENCFADYLYKRPDSSEIIDALLLAYEKILGRKYPNTKWEGDCPSILLSPRTRSPGSNISVAIYDSYLPWSAIPASTRLDRIRERTGESGVTREIKAAIILMRHIVISLDADCSAPSLYPDIECADILKVFLDSTKEQLPILFQRAKLLNGPIGFEIRKALAEICTIQGDLQQCAGNSGAADAAWYMAAEEYRTLRRTPGYNDGSLAALLEKAEILVGCELHFDIEFSYAQVLESQGILHHAWGRTAEASAEFQESFDILQEQLKKDILRKDSTHRIHDVLKRVRDQLGIPSN
jgi:serine/threonine protein kinase